MKFVSDSRRLVPVLGAALVLVLPFGVSAAGAGHGSLDPSFGKGGTVTTAVGFGGVEAHALVEAGDCS
jgi:hypothetical protein